MWRFIASMIVVSSLGACAMVQRAPLTGFWYTSTQSGVAATAQMSTKTGEACASSILGIIATGDASIDAARKAGGINSISEVDEKASDILGLYASYCTIVHGK